VLGDTVREAARRFGDATAIVAPDGSATYRELDERSDRIAGSLSAMGLRAGDRIALRLPSGLGYLLAYLAAAKLGVATAGINSGLAPAEQERMAALIDPAVVLTTPDDVFRLDRPGVVAPSRASEPSDLTALVFTSGTTGDPRAAMFTARQLAAIARLETGATWADHAGTPMLASTHFAHVGAMTKLPWYLQRGLCLHVLPRWRSEDVLRVVVDKRLPEIGAIPPQVALLLRELERGEFDLSCVRRIIAGGAASPPTLIHAAREGFAADYVVRYSSTESGGCGLGTETLNEALTGIGRPRAGIKATVVSSDGELLAHDEIGELCLRTPTAMEGYWRDSEATSEALRDGWLRTGDLATANEDGTFTLQGRLKEMYIRGGYNVYPAEVERELAKHPQLAACAVVPRADQTMGEVGVAVIVPREGQAVALPEIRRFLDSRLAHWKLPEDVLVLTELPLNGTHKVDRRALADMVNTDAVE
jgi:acyl-CoA synthetase (AMP-forming)/AMP-acid ligase II